LAFSLLFIIASGLALTWGVVRLFRFWAIENLMDIPNERSSHETPVPKGGGIGISGITTLLVLSTAMVNNDRMLTAFIFGAAIISLLGFLDDNLELPALLRLLVQVGVVTALVIYIGPVREFSLGSAAWVTMPLALAVIINVFWCLAVTNIYNFMDGIDGFAGLQAVVGGAAWMIVLLMMNQPMLALLAGVIASTSAGFLYWNYPPAKIFMGDVGSTFLGFSFGMLPLLAYDRLADPRLLFLGALVVGPLLFDGTLTIIRRALRRENVLRPHREHLYQKLVKSGYSHFTVDILYLPLMLLCGVIALGLYDGSPLVWLLVFGLIALLVTLTLFVRSMDDEQELAG